MNTIPILTDMCAHSKIDEVTNGHHLLTKLVAFRNVSNLSLHYIAKYSNVVI